MRTVDILADDDAPGRLKGERDADCGPFSFVFIALGTQFEPPIRTTEG